MSLKTYCFFLSKPDDKNLDSAKETETLTLNCELAINDLLTGSIFYGYETDDVHYYFRVVFIEKTKVYYHRAFKTNRPIIEAKKIPLMAVYTRNTGFILRDAVLQRKVKFKKETITRKPCRHCCCRAA